MRRGVRSATGCQECRARHVSQSWSRYCDIWLTRFQVKCDETKPACLRCSKRKSSCNYGKKLEWRHSTAPNMLPIEEFPENATYHWNAQEVSTWTADVMQPQSPFSTELNIGPYLAGLGASFDRSAALMNFYFTRVAPMFSCYDGGKNPFDHLIKQVWHSQRNSAEYNFLIKAIQGLAAVFLSKDDSTYREEALTLQRQAQDQLERVPEPQRHDSKYLFALVLLSISWMYSQDVPSSFKALKRLRDILQLEATKDISQVSKLRDRELRFFWGLQIYCEVFFACTDGFYCLPSIPAQIRYVQDDPASSIYPHPFTGVANAISTTLLEVIQLVKKQRLLARSHAFASRKHLDALQNLIAEAADLEQHAFTQAVPNVQQIEDPGDPATPVEHLVKMAECHHETALLQLYRVFPDLLIRRLALDLADGCEGSAQDVDQLLEKHCHAKAMHILETLSSIPDSSSTTPFQTILLLSTSSELKIDTRQEIHDFGLTVAPPASGFLENSRTMDMRQFVVKRLSSQHPIPGDRLPRLLRVVRKIWSLLDCSGKSEAAYWFDVVMQ
ncbi:hypothetical protein D6D29_09601 [Aureobasidium pullulans]|nr:hypothetical protein D6D29_09601 [Aureobasidium pullulans]